MSIFSKIFQKVIRPVAEAFIPGAKQIGQIFSSTPKAPKQLITLPQRSLPSVLPGAGVIAAGGLGALAGGAAVSAQRSAGQLVQLPSGQVVQMPRKRRRARGITATELKNHRRVQTFLDKQFKCTSPRRPASRVVRRK